MLFITIPNGVLQGECRINGQPCDFEVHETEFWFRYKGTQDRAWDKRFILSIGVGPELTNYYCSPGREA